MPVTPSCTVLDCGILSDPVNGYIQYNNGTTFRSVATYGCDQGYMLTAPPNVECDSTGQWNLSSPPTCEGKHFTHTTNTLCVLHSHHKHTVCPSLTPQTHCVSFTHHKCTVPPLLKPCNTLCFLYVVSVSTETCHTTHCCCRYKYRKRAYMCFLSISCCVS